MPRGYQPGTPGHVLLTGASSGLGAALARHYAAPGVRLSLTARDAGRLAAVAAACRAAGAEVEAAAGLDVTAREPLAAWIEAADDALPSSSRSRTPASPARAPAAAAVVRHVSWRRTFSE
jgi:NAD(P)-dependent dehydrogenase (short-subunit alcohol dehydrogenase family)